MITTLKDLTILEAQDMYSAEQQLVEALPSMIEAASSDSLRQAFEAHLIETRTQLGRVREALEELEAEPGEEECEAMEGLIAEAEEVMAEEMSPEVMDAALVVAAQKIEHYEIASYSSLVSLCEACGCAGAQELFQANLREERQASEKLESIAATEVNQRAATAAEEENEDEDEDDDDLVAADRDREDER